jgi:uncharacterized membrane protein YjgN (DUF898 family)
MGLASARPPGEHCELPRLLAALVLTAGLAYPWCLARYKAFVVSHHALGTSGFQCDLPARPLFGIYLRAGLLLTALMVPIGFGSGYAMMRLELPESIEWLKFFLPVVGFYGAYALVYAYIQARTTNLQWRHTSGPGLRFESTLGARRLAAIYVGLKAITPWTVWSKSISAPVIRPDSASTTSTVMPRRSASSAMSRA